MAGTEIPGGAPALITSVCHKSGAGIGGHKTDCTRRRREQIQCATMPVLIRLSTRPAISCHVINLDTRVLCGQCCASYAIIISVKSKLRLVEIRTPGSP